MSIPIKSSLTKSVIKFRFGSLAHLEVDWESRVRQKIQKSGVSRAHTTIYRWLKNGFPVQTDDIFGFAAALDIDPITLVALDDPLLKQQFSNERRLFHGGFKGRTRLSPFWGIYNAVDGWPNNSLAHTYFDRDWFVEDFTHDPANISNVFAGIILDCAQPPEIPLAFHFAYRRSGALDQTWRPYGTVVADTQNISLFSENGQHQSIKRHRGAIKVETEFGSGPADFRVICIHSFSLALEVPSNSEHCVRFEG